MTGSSDILQELHGKFGEESFEAQSTRDEVLTVWVPSERLREILKYLKEQAPQPYRMLYDLTAIDERERSHRHGQPESDFTVVYHLLSFDRNSDLRLKVGLKGEAPSVPSVAM